MWKSHNTGNKPAMPVIYRSTINKEVLMKKLLILLLTGSLLISTACSSPASASNPPAASASETASTTPEAKDETDTPPPVDESVAVATPFDDVKLTMLLCWNGGYKVPTDQYNNQVATKIREKLGITVEFEGIQMSETEKLNLMFASGDMPDIVNAPFWGGNAGETAVIKKGAAEGQLLPIEDYLVKYPNVGRSYDIGVISQKYLETDLEDPIFEGHRYLVPQETPGGESSITNWAYGAFVRGDVPAALGVDVSTIKTSEQLYEFMVQVRDYGFKDVNGNDTIVATTYHEGWDYGRYAESFNAQKLTSYNLVDGKVVHDFLTQNWLDKNMFIWKLVKEGILDKECFKQTDSQTDEKVGNGTALFFAAQYGVGINSTKLTNLYNTNPEMR
jgi:putative aldouronate transport system substrate-binding protein